MLVIKLETDLGSLLCLVVISDWEVELIKFRLCWQGFISLRDLAELSFAAQVVFEYMPATNGCEQTEKTLYY